MKLIIYFLYIIIFIFIIAVFQLNNASSIDNDDISSAPLDSWISFFGSITFDKVKGLLYNYNNFIHSSILSQLNNHYVAIGENNNFINSTILPQLKNLQSQLYHILHPEDGDKDEKDMKRGGSIGDYMTGVSALSAAAAAFFAAITLRKNSKVNEAQIYLTLRDLFSKHEEIQKNLKGGKWNDPDKGPTTEFNSSDESAKVDSYLRFFEYCYVLIENKVINPRTFNEMYGSYIYDIKRNYQIMQTIEEEGWILFPKLLNKLDKVNK